MSRVVRLHIGAPKTGTTYIQSRLGLNTRTLAQHGVHFPGTSRLARPELSQFRAALDLIGQDWGGPMGHAEGAWDDLVKKVRRLQGNVVISHEILAPAEPAMIARARRDLGADDLHVVYSARDLARQLPAAWQESIKQGRTWTFKKFLKRAQRGTPFFMRAFDIPAVLDTWGAELPPDRVHLVVVPPRGAPVDAVDSLWTRMCRALEIDPAWAPRDSQSRNESLGIAETEVLRRLNGELGRQVAREGDYDALLRAAVAEGTLFSKKSSPVTVGPDHHPWLEEVTAGWIDWIEQSGVDVIGDLDELRPVPLAEGEKWKDPDRVRKGKQLKTAIGALANMTAEAARRPDPERLTAKAAEELKRRLSR